MSLEGYPDWIAKVIDKGGDVSDCLTMLEKIDKMKIADDERMERSQKRELQKVELEKQREIEMARLEHETKMRELEFKEKELAMRGAHSHSSGVGGNFKVSLPKYVDGEDVEVFLRSFERLATMHNWPKKDWPVRLIPQLSGKALQAYSRMAVHDSADYEKIKTAILDRFGLNSWLYREKFRNARQAVGETFKEYAIRVSGFLEHWVESEKVLESYEHLYDLVLREQLMFSSDVELQVWLRERQPGSSQVLIEQAEAYQLAHLQTHKVRNMTRENNMMKRSGTSSGYGVYIPPPVLANNRNNSEIPGGKFPRPDTRRCYKCNSPDHLLPECPERKVKSDWRTNNTGNTNALLMSPKKGRFAGETVKVPIITYKENVTEKELENGLRLVKGKVNGKDIWALRDTGCTTVCVSKQFVEELDKTEEVREISLANGDTWNCPEVIIDLDTPYLKGRVVALVMDSPFADVIIGNVGHIALKDTMKQDSIQAVETRTQKADRKQQESVEGERETEILEEKGKASEGGKVNDKNSANMQHVFGGAEELRQEQVSDPSLNKVRQLTEEQIEQNKPYFKVENKILVRFFKMKSGETIKQIVVPARYRSSILSLAHSSPFGGHLGNKKTRLRIMNHFYWPGIFVDVAKFCKVCDQCQKSLAKGRIGKVPLVSIPPMDVPFQRIAMDIVGPLNRTKSGNKYILVICDYATKYPEAIPLKSIDTETIANELIWFFSRVGIPHEILTDMESNFTSGLMKELCRLLKIHKLCSTPYHPEANGLVENFNGTLKKMLRCYVQECPTEWDTLIPYVLFAYREVPHESTGFSPFELLYSWPVQGPLSILRDTWESSPDTEVPASVVSYVLEVREKFEKMTELAHELEGKAKQKQKVYYDKKTKIRTLVVGDKVLVLLPTSTNKLMAQWKGPYKVIEKVTEVDYKVQWGRKVRKTFHINMLKKWYEKDCLDRVTDETVDVLQIISDVTESNDQYEEVSSTIGNPLLIPTESVDDVQINPGLEVSCQRQLKEVCSKYTDVLTDIPGKTHLAKHDVVLKSDKPIYRKPYAIPYALKTQVQNEIDNMMEAGIVEPSESAWAAPIVIVPKKDKTIRLCIDYRGLNEQTIFDPQPMPKLDEIINKLGSARYMSKIDLTKGYWQIPLTDNAKDKSAFVSQFGHYQFTVMPFGMVNSAASFVRLMKNILEGMGEFTDSFIDDIIVYSEQFPEHLQHIECVLQSLRRARLTAKPSKCSFGFQEMEFLAHVVGNGQVKPTNEKIRAINEIPIPGTKKKVRAFIGLANFYRRFIPNFAHISAPLTDLTLKRSPNKVVWTQREQIAFDTLKGRMSSYPVLYNPNFELEFILQTDSSDRGIGAVLLQEVSGERHPILFISKKLLPREQAYSTIEKECLAIVKSVVTLRVYLYGKRFVIETDHFPLQWLKQMKGNNQRLLRWSLTLQEYNYVISHVKGSKNTVADMLSRCGDK